MVINPELINPDSPKKCWQYNFGVVPPKSYFFGDERVRFWCFWPDGSSAGFKAMQDTHGSGKEIYCAESMEEMLYSHVNYSIYIYISRTASRTQQAQQQQCRTVQQSEEIQGTGSSKSRKIWLDTPAFSLLRSYLKNALWEAPKGYPFRWVVPPPNDVHVHLQLKNTLSPPGHKLNSITYPLELKGTWKSVESKSISIEILLII